MKPRNVYEVSSDFSRGYFRAGTAKEAIEKYQKKAMEKPTTRDITKAVSRIRSVNLICTLEN